VGIFPKFFLAAQGFLKNKICHAMQCILCKIFLEGFPYARQIDMHPICTSILAKFYSCKMWVLQTYPLRGVSPSRLKKHLGIIQNNLF
jgi:hypothetical protein